MAIVDITENPIPPSIEGEQYAKQDVLGQTGADYGSTEVFAPDVPEVDGPKSYEEILNEELQAYKSGKASQLQSIRVPRVGVRYLDPSKYDLQAEERFLRDEQARIQGLEQPGFLDAAQKEADEFKALADQSRAALDSWKPARTGAYKTFTDRVLSALVVGLGEVGRTLTGGKNVGLEMLNKIIDDEARRQQQEYQKLRERANTDQNAYARSMNVLRNERIAFENTKERLFKEASQIGASIGKQTGASMNLDKINTEIANRASAAQAKIASETQLAASKLADQYSAADIIDVKMRKKFQDDMDKSSALKREVGTALRNFEKYLGGKSPTEFLSVRDKLAKDLAQWAKSSDEEKLNFGENVLKGVLIAADRQFGALVDFYNKISAIAFGAASEGQSASSISNKDVQIFINLLASSGVSNKQIYDYMKHLERKAGADYFRSKTTFDTLSLGLGQRVYDRIMQDDQNFYDQNYLDQFQATR